MPRCPANETGYISLQVNVICLLLALAGVTLITRHPDWFGGISAKQEVATPHLH